MTILVTNVRRFDVKKNNFPVKTARFSRILVELTNLGDK